MKRIVCSLLSIFAVLIAAETLTGCGHAIDAAENTSPLSSTSESGSKSDPDCNASDENSTQVMVPGVLGTLLSAAPNHSPKKARLFQDINFSAQIFTTDPNAPSTDVLLENETSRSLEYLGIKFESTLQLGDNDEAGDYEFALLSDEGGQLKIKDPQNDTWRVLIDNSGKHPILLSCAHEIISMTHRTQIPIEAFYTHRGVGKNIGNTLLWRKTTSADQDPLCGSGDADNISYQDLLNRGWKPLAPENFWLNSSSQHCQTPPP